MSLDNANKFLAHMMKDDGLRTRVTSDKKPADVVAIAKELGYDMTANELEQAVKTLRQADSEKPRELTPDEMDAIAGGAVWQGEDWIDGHEMGCLLFYYGEYEAFYFGYLCKSAYYCDANNESYHHDPDYYCNGAEM